MKAHLLFSSGQERNRNLAVLKDHCGVAGRLQGVGLALLLCLGGAGVRRPHRSDARGMWEGAACHWARGKGCTSGLAAPQQFCKQCLSHKLTVPAFPMPRLRWEGALASVQPKQLWHCALFIGD